MEAKFNTHSGIKTTVFLIVIGPALNLNVPISDYDNFANHFKEMPTMFTELGHHLTQHKC